MSRVDTKNNTADLFTKHLDGLRTRTLAKKLGLRFLVGADGRTPTERQRGRGVQRPVYELGEKVLFLPLAPAGHTTD